VTSVPRPWTSPIADLGQGQGREVEGHALPSAFSLAGKEMVLSAGRSYGRGRFAELGERQGQGGSREARSPEGSSRRGRARKAVLERRRRPKDEAPLRTDTWREGHVASIVANGWAVGAVTDPTRRRRSASKAVDVPAPGSSAGVYHAVVPRWGPTSRFRRSRPRRTRCGVDQIFTDTQSQTAMAKFAIRTRTSL